jgi:hypothetical protein
MEVTARISFTRPCLGNVRRSDYDRMPRDGDGTVIFMVTWWRAAFARAAKNINRYYSLVDKIHPALQVRGEVTRYKRWYNGGKKHTIHECFDVGSTVEASFLIPTEMRLEEFIELLEATGLYIGISPYGWKTGMYGHFRVLEVRKGGPSTHKESRDAAPGIPSGGGSAGAGA